ncbi:MAG: hypothetical protein HY706_01440 [Candidatus Hydrogenedentes bacterium]|nr:hypothetical protein [Candidatus Hydrogenedentota bacterium]
MSLICCFLAGSVLGASQTTERGEIKKPYAQETRTAFTDGKGIPQERDHGYPCEDMRSIVVTPEGEVIAGALTGPEGSDKQNIVLLKFNGKSFEIVPFHKSVSTSRYYNHAAIGTGRVSTQIDNNSPISAEVLKPEGGQIFAAHAGVWARTGDKSELIFPTTEPVLSLAAGPDNTIAIGTVTALIVRKSAAGSFEKTYPADDRYSWAPRNVRALVFDTSGRLWFGCDLGVGVWEGHTWTLYTGNEGLPHSKFTCAAPGENGVIWFGTERGAIRFDGEQWAYRASLRWLPDDRVNAIAVHADGTAWIATAKGISRIERKPMNLTQKADYFEGQVEARHNRMGFVTDCELQRRGDITSWRPKVTDNDGMYTAMYGAAESFRYGATKDRDAKRRAQRSFEACKWLVDITGNPGFPARAIVPVDWHEDVNAIYNAELNARVKINDPLWKDILPRWPKSADGKYYWKCDTSSDEMAGHYFFYGVYYDLVCENDKEKEEVRALVRAVTDHIVDNGFLLRDHDGKPTRWANWSPGYLNSLNGWAERGLNSMMMLSFLKVAEHVTGDTKYSDVARMLRDEYNYHINAMLARMYFPPDYVVPWDNNLAFLSYYGLLKYETDPALLGIYGQSVGYAWQFISRHRNPLYNVIYGAFFPDKDAALEDTLFTLRGMPLELIGWEMKNTHRLDVVLDPTPGQEPIMGWHVSGKALPFDERSHVRQDRDAFALDYSEDGGFAEHEGTLYLLPYYMALYHGIIR